MTSDDRDLDDPQLRDQKLGEALTRAALDEAGEKALQEWSARQFFAKAPSARLVHIEGNVYEVHPAARDNDQ